MTAAYKGSVVVNYTGTTVTSVSVDPSTPSDGTAPSVGDVVVFSAVGAGAAAVTTPTGLTNATKLSERVWGTRDWSVWIGTYAGTAITQVLPTQNGVQATASWYSGGSATVSDWIIGTAVVRSVSGFTNTAAGVTTVSANTLVVTISSEATTISETDISSITNSTERKFYPQTTTPQIHTTMFADQVQASAGASGSVVVTYPNSSANGAIVQVGIAPSAGNVPPVTQFTGVRDGYTVQFTDASTDADGTVASWSWDFGDSTSSTSQSPSHVYGKHGTYSVTLTATDNLGSTGSVTHNIIVPGLVQRMVSGSPVEHDIYRIVSGSPVIQQKLLVQGKGSLGHKLYDRYNRYADGTTPTVAETGQTWNIYSGPGYCKAGYFDSVEGTGASYMYASTTGEVTYMGMYHRYNTLSGTRSGSGSSVLLMVWDHIENLSTRVSRAHVAVAPNGITISTFPTAGGSIKAVASTALSPTLTLDTDHLFEIYLSGTTITVYIDGVLKLTGTDSTIADSSIMREVVYEPFYNNDGTDPRAEFRSVWADWN